MKRAAWLALALAIAGGAFAQDPPLPKFRWPLIGKITKAPDGRGIEITAPLGEAVHAAADGEVIYASDELATFGKMVVVRHADEYVTAYAHLSDMIVTKGVKVKRGQILGKSGKSGDAKRPGLHFELRKGETSLDPIGYMAPR